MTVQELMEFLGTCDPEAEVRLAMQPRWAFEYGIADATEVENPDDPCDSTVYLTESNQIGYLPDHVSVAIGWSEGDEDEDEIEDFDMDVEMFEATMRQQFPPEE